MLPDIVQFRNLLFSKMDMEKVAVVEVSHALTKFQILRFGYCFFLQAFGKYSKPCIVICFYNALYLFNFFFGKPVFDCIIMLYYVPELFCTYSYFYSSESAFI